jgi:hypothetical protein
MPPIFLHMALARDVARSLGDAAVDGRAGEYYFGATTPDIRAITRWDRARTHFFDLNVFEHQDSVAELFRQHPHLKKPEALSPETVAFMAGYLTHLVLDERYICDVYRPYFGQLSALGGDLTANTMDRLLQFELDRRRREERDTADRIRDALEGSSLAIDIGFLDSETLGKWLKVAIDQTRHPPDWRRFRFQGGRHLPGLDIESDAALDEFIQRIPDLLQRTIDHVSTKQIDAYLEQGKAAAARAIREYLGVV